MTDRLEEFLDVSRLEESALPFVRIRHFLHEERGDHCKYSELFGETHYILTGYLFWKIPFHFIPSFLSLYYREMNAKKS